MEALSLALAFLIIFLTLSFFLFKNGSDADSRLPPGGTGLPIVGETLDFFINPEKFITDRMKKHSPDIFRTNFFGEKIVVICGPNGHKFLWSNENKYFTTFYPQAIQKLFLTSQPKVEKLVREEAVQAIRGPGFLKPEALVHYLAGMDSIIQQQLKTHLEGKSEVKIHPFSRAVTLTLACKFFMGTDNPERVAKLIRHFDDITEGIHSLPFNFPGTAFYSASKAAGVIRKELATVIKEKKAAVAAGSPSQDLLSTFISTGVMSDAEVADKIMGLLIAGYSTVAATMTFFMKAARDLKGEATGRIAMLGRHAKDEVFWTVNTTQKNPEYFREPNKFDPSRFMEGDAPPAFTYVPFGGGPRMCPGKEYARLVVLAFVHNVVKKYKWSLIDPREKILGSMMPLPEKGLPVRLYPR
ncbi:hypothetical protein RHGRI_004096 [Rhododendron griersonianum]|uniref:Cytochrome P450 n=1 Tax=Rhododendron griersonianum TaxID=479676 RepID=A0AAV6L9Z9_9ERIC|nr:hypothetical protein RHGRI_004096 [Rhododendron griersonianum]